MIHEIAGDLLLCSSRHLAHGVAPNDDFKSGLALALRERFPALYKDFRHYCKTYNPGPGEVWVWSGVAEEGHPVTIASMFTQESSRQEGGHAGPARLEYVNRALHELANLAKAGDWPSLALPRIATGVGRLEWEDVRPILHKTLGGLGIPVYVYTTYKKGVAAEETARV
ncbi:MAG: macro domain-containing protein [Planctomycetes bacterium]|nr:macro domain-containing protein [Planctomycetota bacterium]